MRASHFATCLLSVGLLTACSGQRAAAAVRDATPANINAVLAQARGGDTIRLSPGSYEGIQLKGKTFKPDLVIDAHAATIVQAALNGVEGVTIRGGVFVVGPPRPHPRTGDPVYGAGLRLDKVTGITIRDGVFKGPTTTEGAGKTDFGEGFGVRVIGGSKIEVTGGKFEGFKVAVAMTQIDGFRLAGNSFSDMRADGIDVSMSRNGVIEDNECQGTRVSAAEHPDCIQMWSRPTAPPVADVIIRRNRIEGDTQGIGLHNHVRDGVDDGGFDRILIEDNIINVSRTNAIDLANGRESIIRNNKVTTLPGAKGRASIHAREGSVTMCGNSVAAGAGKPGAKDPPC